MIVMSIDDFLLALIIGGIGLSGAYLRAEYVLHIAIKATQRRKALASPASQWSAARSEQFFNENRSSQRPARRLYQPPSAIPQSLSASPGYIQNLWN
jgi:hypothetical protein